MERSSFFLQSPQLICMDKLLKKKKGIKIDENIYSPEYIANLELQAKQESNKVNYKINIKNVLEPEKSKSFIFKS